MLATAADARPVRDSEIAGGINGQAALLSAGWHGVDKLLAGSRSSRAVRR